MKTTQKKLYDAEKRMCNADAELKYILIRFGDYLAHREKYKVHKGLEAVRYFLVQRHNWLPGDVFALSDDMLQFLISEEMQGWTLPNTGDA